MRKPKTKAKAKAAAKNANRGLNKRLASLGRAAPRRAPAKPRTKAPPAPKPAPAGQPDVAEQLRAGQQIKVHPTRLPSTIKVGKRFRTDKGDIAALARSIDARGRAGRPGLIQPVAIDAQDNLIDGERRLLAWDRSRFAGQPIPVHVIDIDSIIAGEWDANHERKDFTYSEAVAIKHAIEGKLAEMAADRKRSGRKADDGAKGRTREQVAGAVGKKARSLEKAAAVVKAAEENPEKFGSLQADMDRTGRVDGPFKRLQNMKRGEELRNAPPPLPMNGPYHTAGIDFPWPADLDGYRDQDARGYYPYATMSIDAICAFAREQIAPVLAKDSAVWLWIPNFHLVRGCHVRVLEALGVEGSTILTWVKPEIGQGQRLRGATEHAILAIRGKVPVLGTEEKTWFEAPAAEAKHSAKPAKFFELVEKVTPAPRYAYFFAPGAVPEKWDGHGDRVGQASAHVAAEKVAAKRNRKPKAKPDDADPNAWGGHAVTMSIDETVTPPESVGTCACGEVFRVPRDWKGPDEIVARGEEMSRLIAEHRKAVGADGKAQAPVEGAAAADALPTLAQGDKSPPEDVLACLEAIERGGQRPGISACDYLRGCSWIKGKHPPKLTVFGAKQLARLRDMVPGKRAAAAASMSRAADVRAAADAPVREGPHILVTETSHPALFEAFTIISHDSGAGASASDYPVPEAWAIVDDNGLLVLNAALAGLDPQELTVFCIGEEGEMHSIVERGPELAAAHKLLGAFFEGWPAPALAAQALASDGDAMPGIPDELAFLKREAAE